MCPLPQGRRRAAAVVRDRIPLHHFLRLIAPHRLVEHGQAASNDDLVAHLRRAGALTRWAHVRVRVVGGKGERGRWVGE